MTIVIFGATGRTGRRLIQQALAQRHRVRAYVRDRRKFEVPQVEIFEGEIDDVASMERAVEATDAVFSALGPTKTSPPDLMTRAAANIVKGMKKKGIRRLILANRGRSKGRARSIFAGPDDHGVSDEGLFTERALGFGDCISNYQEQRVGFDGHPRARAQGWR